MYRYTGYYPPRARLGRQENAAGMKSPSGLPEARGSKTASGYAQSPYCDYPY